MRGKVGRGLSSGLGSILDDDTSLDRETNDLVMQIHRDNEEKERAKTQNKDAIKKVVLETYFNTDDPKDISIKLDNLISNARIGLGLGIPLSISSSKIRAGLSKLQMIGAFEHSNHYEKEFKLLKRYVNIKLGIKISIATAIIAFVWWFLFLM
jgi:hypothetical protein